PPSAPVSVVSSVNGTSVFLEWGRPLDTGGRSDLQYSVLCQRCSGPPPAACEDCLTSVAAASSQLGGVAKGPVGMGGGGGPAGGSVERSGSAAALGGSVRFVPRPSGLTDPWVTVLNLVAHANYTFRILATNAVTRLSGEPVPYVSVNITTNQAAFQGHPFPSCRGQMLFSLVCLLLFSQPRARVLAIRQENASQNTVSLQWHAPRQPNGVILEYDIQYYEKDHEHQNYSTLKSRSTSAIVSGLKPGTKYIFQIRARTSAGCGRFSHNIEIQTGKAVPIRYRAISITWICVALVSGLLTFLAVVICRKRQGYTLPHYPSLLCVEHFSYAILVPCHDPPHHPCDVTFCSVVPPCSLVCVM
ncbi:unnamed protein product, partial [Gadus morhua 'NCC']